MKSYGRHKAEKFVESKKAIPFVPSTEDRPIGNSKEGFPHKIDYTSKRRSDLVDDTTAPSLNSGGTLKNMEMQLSSPQPTKSDYNTILIKIPRQTGLGELGNQSVGQSTFHQDPVSAAEGEQMTSMKGQFETFDNYRKRRQKLNEEISSFGGPVGQTPMPQQNATQGQMQEPGDEDSVGKVNIDPKQLTTSGLSSDIAVPLAKFVNIVSGKNATKVMDTQEIVNNILQKILQTKKGSYAQKGGRMMKTMGQSFSQGNKAQI